MGGRSSCDPKDAGQNADEREARQQIFGGGEAKSQAWRALLKGCGEVDGNEDQQEGFGGIAMVGEASLLHVEGDETEEHSDHHRRSLPGDPVFLEDDDGEPEED